MPFLAREFIRRSCGEVLERIGYRGGAVSLKTVCDAINVGVEFSDQELRDADGRTVLGTANFDHRSIQINSHSSPNTRQNPNRERFTLAHEIGHFCLEHDRYLRSESVVKKDLFINDDSNTGFNFERLEFQANSFASNLILPDEFFKNRVADCRRDLGIKSRGHGYLFVDDQPCNLTTYGQVLSNLCSYFEASKAAVQIKLKSLGMLNDQRRSNWSSVSKALGEYHPATRPQSTR